MNNQLKNRVQQLMIKAGIGAKEIEKIAKKKGHNLGRTTIVNWGNFHKPHPAKLGIFCQIIAEHISDNPKEKRRELLDGFSEII